MDMLQQNRKEEIPKLKEKYQKLVDNIFDAVSKPLPNFKDIIDNDTNEVLITSEQQLYSFVGVRDRALDTANNILNKINDLERELYDPNFGKEELAKDTVVDSKNQGVKKYTKK